MSSAHNQGKYGPVHSTGRQRGQDTKQSYKGHQVEHAQEVYPTHDERLFQAPQPLVDDHQSDLRLIPVLKTNCSIHAHKPDFFHGYFLMFCWFFF